MNAIESLTRSISNLGLLEASSPEVVEIIASSNSIGEYLEQALDKNLFDGNELSSAFSKSFGLPELDVNAINVDDMPLDSIDVGKARENYVIPIYLHNNKLYVATSDPTNKQAIDDIKFATSHNVLIVQANPASMRGLLRKLESSTEDNLLAELEGADTALLDDVDIENEGDQNSVNESEIDDAPIVRYVNKLLLDGIRQGVSDIHIEPFEKHLRIRYRVDGVLHEVSKQSINLAPRIAARIKILSQLDISERRVPQDGRMKLKLSKSKSIDFRVNTLPTMYGEKVVIRILSMGTEGLTLENLGFTLKQRELYAEAVARPYGMVLITGPTGSGKTVSLYTALGMLNTIDRNISTAEDPVEINLEGINQVNINERANLDFATALRAFLRQDPDIIMVGEIRDLETAEIAIKAAQTGHLVMSTLHTNDAPATLTRLLNMGVPSFNIASSIHLIVAQRLARRLCNDCKVPADYPKKALLELGFNEVEISDLTPYEASKGCSSCSSGYKGRTGIFQVLPITDELKSLIMKGCTQKDIEDIAAKNGIMDLRQAGLEKVKNGTTSIKEVERVTNQ